MIFNVVVLLLVLAITFLNSIYGLYSGLINVFCAIVAAAAALGFFEPATDLLSGSLGLSPTYSGPVAMVLLYCGVLIVLRLLADMLLRGNVRVPAAVDWGGGAVCGLLIGLISTGVMTLAVLMLPIGDTIMGFQRIQRADSRTADGFVEFQQNRFWLRQDEFVAGLVSQLSGGSLSGSAPLEAAYPDFTEWVSWTGNIVQPESLTAPSRNAKNGGDGFENGVRVVAFWKPAGSVKGRYRSEKPTKNNQEPPYKEMEYRPAPGQELIAARLELNPSASDQDEGTPHHRFRPTMIRLVGRTPDGETAQYWPRLLGNVDPKLGSNLRIVDADNNFAVPASGPVTVDAYFEVDEGFEPGFVEYRRFARVAADVDVTKLAGAPPSDAQSSAPPVVATEDSTRRRRGFMDGVRNPAGDVESLPGEFSLPRIRSFGEVQMSGNKLASGRFFGPLASLRPSGSDQKLTQIALPADQRLAQIPFRPKRAESIVGQVFNFVGRTNQYFAVDDVGTKHKLMGYWAIVPRDGGEYIEFFLAPPGDPTFRSMLDFKEVKPAELMQEGAEVGLLFYCPLGARIVDVVNQAGASVGGDLHIQLRTEPR